MEPTWEHLLRMLAACIAGAIIGFERELHDKPAGLRTNVLICLGAAVFTLLSYHVAGAANVYDPGRIAAQIVTGVGFLGAGTILQLRSHVVGLTTAATIWLVASVGMAFGAGAFGLGAMATVLATGVLLGLSVVEARIAAWRTTAHFEIETDPGAQPSKAIAQAMRELGISRSAWHVDKLRDGLTCFLEVIAAEPKLAALQDKLMEEPGVKSLRRL
jgi:putative Mg2+ transporter-C (MgtC) family protein